MPCPLSQTCPDEVSQNKIKGWGGVGDANLVPRNHLAEGSALTMHFQMLPQIWSLYPSNPILPQRWVLVVVTVFPTWVNSPPPPNPSLVFSTCRGGDLQLFIVLFRADSKIPGLPSKFYSLQTSAPLPNKCAVSSYGKTGT